MASLKLRVSRMADGRKNLSASSWPHCFRRLAGTMTSSRRFRSAHFWAISSPASIVFPSPLRRPGSPARKWVAEGEQRRLDLVRVQVDLGIRQHGRQLLDAVGGTPLRQFVGKILGVVGGNHLERQNNRFPVRNHLACQRA